MTGKVRNNWKSRYNREVELQTQKYEALNTTNALTNTTIRKVTPEEEKEYENLVKKQNNNYLFSQIYKSLHTMQTI